MPAGSVVAWWTACRQYVLDRNCGAIRIDDQAATEVTLNAIDGKNVTRPSFEIWTPAGMKRGDCRTAAQAFGAPTLRLAVRHDQ
jgi:hypothetical protein